MNNQIKNASVVACVGLMVALSASATGERTFYTSDLLRTNDGWWRFYRQPEGTPLSKYEMSLTKDGDVTIVHTCPKSQTMGMGYAYDFFSWTIAGTNVTTEAMGPWVDGAGSVSLGAGGLTMTANNVWRFGNTDGRVRVYLKESQTWSGPADGSDWAWMGIGCKEFYSGYYWQSRIAALKDLTWTLDGRIQVTLSDANDLSNVDVIVNPLARLVLVKGYGEQVFNGKLGAKSLTLKGGDAESPKALFTVGAANPSTHFGETVAPSTFDAATVAPVVNLVDGADVTGGSVDYSVAQLNVTGGDSTFSGNVVLRDDVAIDIADGATFAFTGTLAADDGKGLTVTGAGRYLAPSSGLSTPVRGSGVLAFDPGAGNEIVLHEDLSAFTGTILALSGTVFVHEDSGLPMVAKLVAEDGAAILRFKSSDAGDFTDAVTGHLYYRAPDGVRHHYLFANQFTKNTTGGQLTYRRNRDVDESVAWIDDSILVFDTNNSGGIEMSSDYNIYGFVAEQLWNGTPFMSGAGVLTFGAKGIHGDYGDANSGISFWKNNTRVKLATSQSWTGPNRARSTGSTSPLRFNLGKSGDYNGSLSALVDGLTLTIAQDALLNIYWPTNSFANANLTVRYPALLCLPTHTLAGNLTHGRLNADTLTVDGGACVYFGAKNFAIGYNYVQSPTNVTADTYAKKIVLKDGGALTAKTLALWDDVTLSATGGINTLVGAFEFQNAETALEVAAGATMDLATEATLTERMGVSAVLNVEGTGTLKIKANTYALTGGIVLNGGTLAVAGAPSVDVSGTGTVDGDITMNRFVADAEATGALSFNGTLTIGANPVVELRNLPETIEVGDEIVLGTVGTVVGKANLANATFVGDPLPQGMPVRIRVNQAGQLVVRFGKMGLVLLVN